jgi:hypothetical protein
MQLINRGFLRRSAGSQPKTPTIAENPPEPELIPGPVKAAAIAQIVIASAAAIGLIYLLKVVL